MGKIKSLINIFNQISSVILKNDTNILNKHIVKRNKYQQFSSILDLNEWLNEVSTLYTPLVVKYKINNDIETKTLIQDKRLYLTLWIVNKNMKSNNIQLQVYVSEIILDILKYKLQSNIRENKRKKLSYENKTAKTLKIFEKQTIIIIYKLIISAVFMKRF